MIILAIDTASEFGSLAIRSGGTEIAKRTVQAGDGFAHRIFGELEELKTQAKLDSFGAVSCFAAANGPGSFTGVRVGLSIAKGLAEALGKRAAAVSNLQAVSCFGESEWRAVVMDARRGDVFAAVYDAAGRMVKPEVVTKLPEWLERLPDGKYDFIAQDPAVIQPGLSQSKFAGSRFIEAPRELATAVALLAESSEWFDPAAIDANYVRRSDAELFWSDR